MLCLVRIIRCQNVMSRLFTLATKWSVTLTGQSSPARETDSWNADPNPEENFLVHQSSIMEWSAEALTAFHLLVSRNWINWRAYSDLG